jgi:hypothetical protein
MLILFLKSKPSDANEQLPLPEIILRILEQGDGSEDGRGLVEVGERSKGI